MATCRLVLVSYKIRCHTPLAIYTQLRHLILIANSQYHDPYISFSMCLSLDTLKLYYDIIKNLLGHFRIMSLLEPFMDVQ